MKSIFSVRFIALATFLTLLSASLFAADYYVVIGTFADESNAKRFTSSVSRVFKDASYSFNESRRLYYVHVLKTSRKEEARNWSLYLRNEVGFRDAWVVAFPEAENIMLTDDPGETHTPRYVHELTPTPDEPRVFASARPSQNLGSYAAPAAMDKPVKASAAWNVHGNIAFMTNSDATTHIKDNPLVAASPVFTFKVETPDGQPLSTEVMLVNFEKVKKLASFNPGEHVAIKASKKNQMVTFVCDVLGYAMETRMFNIDHLSRGRDIVQNKNGMWEVTFKLRKLQVDEVAFMNKTTFYPNATVLEPSSDVEINNLLEMMQTNPGYKIVLHAHCNPEGRREIKVASGRNYFDLEAAESKTGSDKVLTRLRAETIRNFLIDHGIDKKRIGIVGWGSSDLLVSSTADDAYVNDRIELELVAE
ncbi:MAG TPA: OmpA family protein [Chryseosolibacter sp.]|nr:OmpA family protein [Chryseosolibacter sp.]